jgi:peptidoglycan/xylan/chitin deacetylase (PgdA/CDA1 family)
MLLAALLIAATPAAAQDVTPPDEAATPAQLEVLEQIDGLLHLGILATTELLGQETGAPVESSVEPPVLRPAPAKIIRRGPRSSGAVALTFDDGYNSRACASIARTLRERDAIGTFFINGIHLQRDPDKWRRILGDMPVGNHTRSHPFLTREPHPVVRRQIRDNETIHERVLGRPMLKVLRPPYGAHGPRVGRIATELGYDQVVLWSVDTHDWKRGTSARAIVRRATRASPGSIILMHCSRGATARALPAIIRHYRARGIELAGLDVVLKGAKADHRTADHEGYGGS